RSCFRKAGVHWPVSSFLKAMGILYKPFRSAEGRGGSSRSCPCLILGSVTAHTSPPRQCPGGGRGIWTANPSPPIQPDGPTLETRTRLGSEQESGPGRGKAAGEQWRAPLEQAVEMAGSSLRHVCRGGPSPRPGRALDRGPLS